MNAAILGLFRDPVDADAITLETETNGDRGITVDQHQYLDDATIYSGTAAGFAEVTETEVYVHDHTIETEQVEGREHVAADYYADFDAGWVGIETGKAEFIWDRLGAMADSMVERATIDLDAFARDYREREDAHVWQVGRSTPDTSEDDDEGVTISYHDDAHVQDATRGGLAQIGISYRWKGKQYVYGTIAASGYVAIYSSMNVPQFGRWLRDELLPYASLPESGQSLLDETESDVSEVTECEECGREPEKGLEETDAGMLCVVCADKHEDAQEKSAVEKLDDLDTVTVTDGGSDE